LFGEGAIEVVPLTVVGATPRAGTETVALSETPPPAGGAEDLRPVDGLGEDDRADRVVEVEMFRADQRRDVGGQGGRSQRTGCKNDRSVDRCRNARNLLAADGNQRVRPDCRSDM